MDPNFKDSSKDSAIKRLVCSTVWHSCLNGFMAVQTQLGRFQNDTHLFFLPSFCETLWTKGWAEIISFIGLFPTGTRARAHGHLEEAFVFYLGTFRPLLLCFRGIGMAIKIARGGQCRSLDCRSINMKVTNMKETVMKNMKNNIWPEFLCWKKQQQQQQNTI